MLGLPDGRKIFKIGLAVLTQYRRMLNQPASQPSFHSKYRASKRRAGYCLIDSNPGIKVNVTNCLNSVVKTVAGSNFKSIALRLTHGEDR